MRAVIFGAGVGLLTLLVASSCLSQSPTNPDVSAVVDTRCLIHDDEQFRPDESGKAQLVFEEFELDINGYLNPYARADIALAIGGTEGEVDVEEAFVTLLRGLPLRLQFRAGQLQPDFGRINTQHPHVWSWVTRPLMFQEMFGEEGLHDVGLSLASLVPIGGSALSVSATLLKTGNLIGDYADSGAVAFDEATPRSAAPLGRLSLFAPLGDYTSMEAGLSYLRAQAPFKPDGRVWADLANLDFKLKWRPNSYQSLALVGEALLSNRKIATPDVATQDYTEADVRSLGFFASADYQFRKRYDVGTFYDFTQRVYDDAQDLSGYGVFAGFSIAEESTRFGLLLRRDQGSDVESYNTAMLQILWALGPHKPHPF